MGLNVPFAHAKDAGRQIDISHGRYIDDCPLDPEFTCSRCADTVPMDIASDIWAAVLDGKQHRSPCGHTIMRSIQRRTSLLAIPPSG
jgi:hypothetical protein